MNYGLTERSYQKIKEVINKYSDYEFIVFGSRARGDYKNGSDLDLAVKGEIDEKNYYAILNSFDLLDIPYMIDIVFICKVKKKELLDAIQRDGVKFE